MSKLSVRILFAAVVASVAVAPASAQQFIDGGFETTNPNGPANFTAYNTPATLGASGFSAIGPTGTLGTVLAIGNAYSETAITFNTSATGGLVALDLTGATAVSGNVGIGSGVQSVVGGLTPGQAYFLFFSVGRATSTTNANYPTTAAGDALVGVSIDGGAITTFTNSNQTDGGVNYQDFTTTFTAAAASVTFSFTSQTGTANFVGLDNVSLSPVPEPATIGLMATAGLGLAGFIRRRLV